MRSPRAAVILLQGLLCALAVLLASSVAHADQPPSTPEGPPCRREDVGKPCNSRGSLCREKERRQGRKVVKVYRCDFDWSQMGGPEEPAPKKRFFGCAMGASPPDLSGIWLPALLTLTLLLRRRSSRLLSARSPVRS